MKYFIFLVNPLIIYERAKKCLRILVHLFVIILKNVSRRYLIICIYEWRELFTGTNCYVYKMLTCLSSVGHDLVCLTLCRPSEWDEKCVIRVFVGVVVVKITNDTWDGQWLDFGGWPMAWFLVYSKILWAGFTFWGI